jgi:hypothetical protein
LTPNKWQMTPNNELKSQKNTYKKPTKTFIQKIY